LVPVPIDGDHGEKDKKKGLRQPGGDAPCASLPKAGRNLKSQTSRDHF
jgi:hypothetical protein